MNKLRRGCLLAVLLWAVGTGLVTYGLTRRARPPFPEPAPAGMVGLQRTTGDGLHVGAWLLDGPGPCVLLLHGNGASRTSEVEFIRWVGAHGAAVLAPSLRCHGDSEGKVNDFGYGAALDVAVWADELRARYPGRPLLIFGRSLGASAALFACSGLRADGYLLESPFFDLPHAVRNRLRVQLGRGLDEVAFAGMLGWAHALLPVAPEAIAPGLAASGMPSGTPVTVMAGEADWRAPIADAQGIVERIPGAHLVTFPGAGHGGLQASDPGRYESQLDDFLR